MRISESAEVVWNDKAVFKEFVNFRQLFICWCESLPRGGRNTLRGREEGREGGREEGREGGRERETWGRKSEVETIEM